MTADTVSPREQPLIRPLSTDPDAWAYTGFIVVMMQGVFAGYIQSVAVRADCRSRGLGSALIGFAERRILRDTPEEQLNRRGRRARGALPKQIEPREVTEGREQRLTRNYSGIAVVKSSEQPPRY